MHETARVQPAMNRTRKRPLTQLELFAMIPEPEERDSETKESKSKMSSKKVANTPTPAPKPSKRKGSPKKAATPPPWTFPKSSLEDALVVARAIEDKNAGNPMRAADLVKAVGFNQPNDWRFLDLLRSANQYGLVEGTGKNAVVSLQPIGQDVVAPSSAGQRQQALMKAFRNVEEFRKVEEFYGGKRIPEDEFFENTLVREFSIPRERVQHFIRVFTENLRFLNLFNARRTEPAEPPPADLISPAHKIPEPEPKPDGTGARVREFLDTCFVMMPFGNWFDRYYKEIYVPAIRDAGFEPIRGDELFTTGTVVEQLWEQVQKSTVLLADLSDKNANVFYELVSCPSWNWNLRPVGLA